MSEIALEIQILISASTVDSRYLPCISYVKNCIDWAEIFAPMTALNAIIRSNYNWMRRSLLIVNPILAFTSTISTILTKFVINYRIPTNRHYSSPLQSLEVSGYFARSC